MQNIINSQQKAINTQQNSISNLQTKVETLTTDVADLRHVEQGVLDCHPSSTWTDGLVPRPGGEYHSSFTITRHITQTFSKVYKTPPVVFLSTSWRGVPKSNNVVYGTKLVNVTTTSFTMFCGGDDESDDALWDMDVDWLSIPV